MSINFPGLLSKKLKDHPEWGVEEMQQRQIQRPSTTMQRHKRPLQGPI